MGHDGAAHLRPQPVQIVQLQGCEVARGDQKWASPVTSLTGYAFAAMFYFVCCYAMSRYAQRVEARLARRSAYKGL